MGMVWQSGNERDARWQSRLYSNKSWVNKFMGGTIYVLAGNVYNWQVQHNVLHHTYTNIPGTMKT
jgi:fatty acid desaturase